MNCILAIKTFDIKVGKLKENCKKGKCFNGILDCHHRHFVSLSYLKGLFTDFTWGIHGTVSTSGIKFTLLKVVRKFFLRRY